MKKMIDFLYALANNNNKPWFDTHKEEYKSLHKDFLAFADELIAGIAQFDKSIEHLTAKDCTYRIYRDIRFSPDKTPYKNHAGIFICPSGKKGPHSGYYMHLEPINNLFFVCAGLFMPESKIIKSVREEIMLNGENFDKLIKNATQKGFFLDTTNNLKRVPNGYSAEDAYAEYYKLRDYLLMKSVTKDYFLDENLLSNLLKDFENTYEFSQLLNQSVDYALEEK